MNNLEIYSEIELVGSGGFADVYRAIHLVTRDQCAVKKSRSPLDCVARTKREIEVQRRLLHANIMPILDWADDGSWFVMPLAVGDVAEIRARQGFDNASLLRLVEDVAAGLAVAHRRGLVHRDLTPANVLWVRDRWAVADWGFVKMAPGETRTKLTRTGVGTEGFTAPEVYRDGTVATCQCDIYSLGRVVAWVLQGSPLSPNEETEIADAGPWAAFIRETTRLDPAERPESVHEALNLLADVVKAVGVDAPLAPIDERGHIDTVGITSAALKRILLEPSRRIALEELLDREAELLYRSLSPEAFPVSSIEQGQALEDRLHRYAATCTPLMDLFINGCAYGNETHTSLWTRHVRRIGHPTGRPDGNKHMVSLRHFPTTLLIYAGGLASLARDQWLNLPALATRPMLAHREEQTELPAIRSAAALRIFDQRHSQTLPGRAGRHTPPSDWLFDYLRQPLSPLIRIDADYERHFDMLEYLYAMAFADTRGDGWIPTGRFAWKDGSKAIFGQKTLSKEVREQIESLQEQWPPIRAGLFLDATRALAAAERVEAQVNDLHWE